MMISFAINTEISNLISTQIINFLLYKIIFKWNNEIRDIYDTLGKTAYTIHTYLNCSITYSFTLSILVLIPTLSISVSYIKMCAITIKIYKNTRKRHTISILSPSFFSPSLFFSPCFSPSFSRYRIYSPTTLLSFRFPRRQHPLHWAFLQTYPLHRIQTPLTAEIAYTRAHALPSRNQ